jgi:hypothetical protein
MADLANVYRIWLHGMAGGAPLLVCGVMDITMPTPDEPWFTLSLVRMTLCCLLRQRPR